MERELFHQQGYVLQHSIPEVTTLSYTSLF